MVTEEDLEKYGFKGEYFEESRKNKNIFTGYPAPVSRHRLIVEAYNISIEEPYFWVLQYLRHYAGYPFVDKITDIFAAAENSAFFGASQQRLGAQQDKISQYLATIGKMVKELFQLVRELRILDERLDYYVDSSNPASRSRESAEITLKGIWVDMVEQGAKNPASVYGMAREVQFTTLPDLFFATHPLKQEDVDDTVETQRAQFNRKVREVLKRKLRSFLTWKEHTFEEMKTRRVFTLRYLRQHYEIIRMYITWVKPYLKNVQRLQMDMSKMDSADIISFFESAMMEVEILGRKDSKKGEPGPVTIVHFLFRSRPEMTYQQEGYQRGPLHVGRIQMNFRSYSWTPEEIENYKSLRRDEEFKLLGVVDASVKAAMEALGDELMRYLAEAGDEDLKKRKKEESGKIPSKIAPKVTIFSSFQKIFNPNRPQVIRPKKNTAEEEFQLGKTRSKAAEAAKKFTWSTYHHFKKHHSMLSW